MNFVKFCDRVIEWSFYLLFFLVPLVFSASTSELFEFNKMMLTYALTIVIVASWIIKMLAAKKFLYRRTLLEIPLLAYLGSHILSTLFSIDPHISVWGYYSRFHEGLLASISYTLLYFAAVSNLKSENIKKILFVSFVSAAIVSVWGIFEHFGHSFSCQIITGKFNVDCWIQDVQNRVYATLGQPNWMAAYLNILILTSLGFVHQFKILNFKFKIQYVLPALFFAALLFTKSRSGILGLGVGLGVYLITSLIGLKFKIGNLKFPAIIFSVFLTIAVVFGLPFAQTEKYSLEYFLEHQNQTTEVTKPTQSSGYIDIGISESGDIRKIVWEGAVKVWQRYPIFGSGVETFAYAYYKDRPVAHNMVSEWDFLYNKAHNEYLNILATTGTVGMIAYLSLIGTFSFFIFHLLFFNSNEKFKMLNDKLIFALFAGWVSILVTNFFGFSVVIIGLYFFLIPAFCYVLATEPEKIPESKNTPWFGLCLVCFVGLVLELGLLNMWNADKAYAYGKNLDSVQQYVNAYPYLKNAVTASPDEPAFLDELSFNQAVLATALFNQIENASEGAIATLSAQEKMQIQSPQLGASVNDLIDQSIKNSNKVIEISPDSLPFWKSRTKVFYQLSTIDSKYNSNAIDSLKNAVYLAPTDAKVHYNLGLLLGRQGSISEGIKLLEETAAMKPDYRDAYYTLGLFYAEVGDKTKAREKMQYILDHIGPDKDTSAWLGENKE